MNYNVWQQRAMEVLIQFNIGIELLYGKYWNLAWKWFFKYITKIKVLNTSLVIIQSVVGYLCH